jgi:hypothetical protein
VTRCRSVYAFILSLLLVGVAAAQIASTSLRGVVKDPSGAVVPNAKITLTNSATGQVISATSNAAGEYTFAQIPPARYTITASATGFGDQSKEAELLVNQPATVDFAMTVKAIAQVVNVSGETEMLNTTDASLGTAMSNTTIQELPSYGRNVPSLLALQPGVLFLGQDTGGPTTTMGTQNDSRSGAVDGGRSDQGNITLDGVDDNDQINGYAFTGVLRETQDSVEEFRVTTGLGNSDEGRSSGAQISLITKTGTNKFHGAAYEYNRPTMTVANDWFNKAGQVASGLPNIPPKVVLNTFGGDLGGPIIKDKLFFFGNYEGQREASDSIVARTVPTATFQAGELSYPSNGNEITLSSAQVATLDAGCQVCGSSQYPFGPGPDPNAVALFRQYPTANGTTLGDGGYNTGSYTFASPAPATLNTSIARLDWDPSAKQRIFVRLALQKDTQAGVEQFPGQPPSTFRDDNTKGIIAGDTWTISPNLVNDIRYGYIRQGFSVGGVGKGDYVDFRFLDTATAETRSSITSVPVNNIVDNFSWNKGRHTIQVGGNWRLVHQNFGTDQNSYNGASSNPYWLGGNPPQPSAIGQPAVDTSFGDSYVQAYANLVGTIPSVTDIYNYAITNPAAGSLLSDGAFINRHYSANEYEYYIQDTWHPTDKLTLTFGIRHSILQTPWETKGQEIAPTISTDTWYKQREASALQGQIYEPDLVFQPTGPYYHRPGYWPKSKLNIAPRFALAYALDNKTSIRAGFGIYYDHYGEALINTFDQFGSYGVSSQVTNPAGQYTSESSPRFTGRQNLPFNNGTPASTTPYPYAPPLGNFAITWGLDSRIKTPYAEAMDFSVQRALPGGFALEVDYVGRLGRHLLQSLDLAEPVDYVDPGGGGDYFTNGAALSAEVDANNQNANASVAPIRYFEDLFPWMANFDYPGESATQAIYTDEWAPFRENLGETTALSDLDFFCFSGSKGVAYNCPGNHVSRFWQDQFSSLYALSSIGMSYYNAGQFILRHPTSHGLDLDFSYTLSKSIDMGSDAERSTEFPALNLGLGGSQSSIINTWKPYLNRGVSDFDTKNMVTGDWVYQFPVGKGRAVLGNNRFVDFFAGGWNWTGIARWTSGLPFSLFAPGWSTDWQIESYGVETAPVKTHFHVDAGNPQQFVNAAAINNGIGTGTPVRLAYAGETGQRNNFRGEGVFDTDTGLNKTWNVHEHGALRFAWEVFNATNSVRFDPAHIGAGLTGGNLGIYSAPTLSNYRLMQFSLRYDF